MHADETVTYYASKTVPEIEQILTNEFACLCQWLLDNNLFLNVKKTECLLFGTAPRLSKVNDFTVMTGNSVLRRVVEFKYLGVVLDECLNWKAQTSAVFSKVSRRIGMLRRLRDHSLFMTGGGLAKFNYQLNKMSSPPTSQKNSMTHFTRILKNSNPPPPPPPTVYIDT